MSGRGIFRNVVCFMIATMITFGVCAQNGELQVESAYSHYNVNAYLSYYLDPNGLDTVESVAQRQGWIKNVSGNALNFGFIDYPVWLRFNISFSPDNERLWNLVIPYPLLQSAEIYVYSNQRSSLVWSSDLSLADTDSRNIKSHLLVFRLPEKLGSDLTFYIRARSNTALQIPVEVWSRQALAEHQNVSGLLWGIYFGVIIAMCLYNGFLFVSIYDRTYVYYVLMLISTLFLMLSLSGYGETYLWESPGLTQYILPIAATMTSFWLLCFALSFLSRCSFSSLVRRSMKILALANILVLPYLLAVPELGAQISSWIGVATVIGVLVAGLSAWASGYVVARYFLLATTALALGASLYLANAFGLLPSSLVTNYAFQAGSIAEAMLLSFALAHRIKEERKLKLDALRHTEEAQRALVDIKNQALAQALRDPGTKMPNDAFLLNRIGELIQARHVYESFAIVLLYFPQLKEISASMGRRLAAELFDSLIATINTELLKSVQTVMIDSENEKALAVLEFGSIVFICKSGEAYRPVRSFTENLLQRYDSALEIGDSLIKMSVYSGIASYPKDGDMADLLLQHACSARDFGLKNSERVTLFSSEIDAFGMRRLALVGALSAAIRSRSLELYVQPQFNCKTLGLCGAEILLRWCDDKLGIVSPVEFIEVAEEAGLMAGMTRFVIDESFKFKHDLDESGFSITLSINLSIQNLTDPKLISYITSTAEKFNVNLTEIVFEVTETSMSEDMEMVVTCLTQLVSLGCKIALDDYGTGYSSLAYLSRMPIHELKIDRSFIQQMGKSVNDYQIVENTVKLARALQIQTVAEGVEDSTALSSVTLLGCGRSQGYYFAKPMPISQFFGWAMRQAG